MASIKMISEEEATGKAKDIYEEIKSKLGIDFIPNLLFYVRDFVGIFLLTFPFGLHRLGSKLTFGYCS